MREKRTQAHKKKRKGEREREKEMSALVDGRMDGFKLKRMAGWMAWIA